MNESNQFTRENNAASFEKKMDLAKVLSDSARRTDASVREHPYIAVGIVAGMGLACVGMALWAGRRKSFLERMFG